MTAPIGYVPVQLIPSLDGFSAAVDKQLGGTIKVAGTRGGKQFGAGMAAGLKASEADVKKAFDNHAKLADRAADATGKLKVAQAGYDELVKKGVTEGKRYAAASAAKEKAARDEARALKTATDALKDYEQAAKDAQSSGEKASTGFLSGLRGTAAGAGSAGSEAAAGFAEGFAGSSALLRLGAVGGPVGIAVAAAGTVIGGLLWKNIEAGIDREPGRDLIQARLGANAEDIKNIAKASGAAYANNFGDSVESNLQASQLAIQGGLVTSAMDPALQATTEKLQAITQLVGGDLSDTVKSVSILLRSGMASSADEAFDVIAKGYQVTGDLGADWLDSIGEYSSGWKNAGFTAEQALALIKQAQDNGVDVTDRSADALREFGRRVSEEGPKMVAILDAIGLNGQDMYDKFKKGGPEAFNAFDQVFDKIRDIKDPVDRNQAALALLGDTAGDFIDAFAKWDPSAAVDSLGSIQGAAQNASHVMGDNVVGSFETARRTIDIALDGVQDSLAAAFGPSLANLANGVTSHKSEISAAFVDMGKVVGNFGGITIGILGGVTEAFGLFAGGIGNVLGGILKTGSALQRLTGDTETADEWNRQADALFGLGEDSQATGKTLQQLSQDVKKATDSLGVITPVTHDAATSTGGLGDAVKTLGGNVRDLPKQLPSWFTNIPGGLPSVPWMQPPPGAVPPTAPGATLPNGLPASALPPLNLTPGGGGRGALMNLQLSQGAASSGAALPGESPKDFAHRVEQPFWESQGLTVGDHAADKYGEHQNGALDLMVDSIQEGNSVLQKVLSDPNVYGAIFNNSTYGYGHGTTPKDYSAGHTGDPSQDHTNHVHVWYKPGNEGNIVPGGIPASLSSNTTAVPSALAAGSSTDDIASTIIGQAQQRGFSRDQAIAVLSTAMQESGLNPAAQGGGGAWHGIFQQDASYPGRDDPNTNISTFFDRLGAPSDNIWAQIFGLQQGTPLGSSGARTAYLSEIQSKSTAAAATYDRLAGSGAPQSAASLTAGASPNLTNAYGAGYKPGIGTPGVNEYGEPGYYETDPRRIAQAARSAEDATQHIADADQALADSNKDLADAVKERDAVAKLSEVQRIAQGKDLDKANADVERLQKQVDRAGKDAGRSREDADWAQQDLAEAQQGSFKSAQKDSSSKSGGGKGLSLPSTFSGFGSAIGEFAGGQIGSALDVFGVNDSPPILQAASQLLSGVKLGGHDPSGESDGSLFDGGNMFGGDSAAAPLSASSPFGGAVPPENTHGMNAGQLPGPQTVNNWTINARDTEDSFVRASRIQKERTAAKLDRF